MTSEAEALASLLESRLPSYLEEVQQLCAIECPTSSKTGVDEAGDWVRLWATALGWDVREWRDSFVGDSLLVTCTGGNPGGHRILLVAHLDTVYPIGTATARPMQRVDDRLLAPGVADNKTGLLSALYAMAALQDLALMQDVAEIGLLCGGDEETDMRSSTAFLTEVRSAYHAGLVLEAARQNGDVVAARKGRGHFVLRVTGKAAHAGVEPHLGANAIVALAQQIVGLHLLNGARPGVGINVGVIVGGIGANVVPDSSMAEIDVRISSPSDRGWVQRALDAIASTPYVPGTSARLDGGWLVPPMPRSQAGDELLALARDCSHELGFSVGAAETGGVSYANILADLGMPVIDGLGPVGGLDHSPDEYVAISSIVPRTALLALLILRLSQRTND